MLENLQACFLLVKSEKKLRLFLLQDPMRGMKMHCPRPDCKWMYFQNQIEDHCASRHGIKTGHTAWG